MLGGSATSILHLKLKTMDTKQKAKQILNLTMLNEKLIQTLHGKIERRKFSRAEGPAELSKAKVTTRPKAGLNFFKNIFSKKTKNNENKKQNNDKIYSAAPPPPSSITI